MNSVTGSSPNNERSDPRSWSEAFDRFANKYSEKIITELISVPSVNPPGHEAAAAKTLASLLEPLGVSCELQYITSDRANLLATVGSTDDRRRLALCSHLDVVAAGEISAWTSDPFAPRRINDLIYGRGSCDAKGCVAAMALSIAFFAQRPDLLPGSLGLAAVAGEELGGIGSKHLMQSGCSADGVIIGEPTNMRIALGHKGRIEVDVMIRGRSGHASAPYAAVNPIDSIGDVVDILKELADRIADRRHPMVGAASLAITTIKDDGTHTNTIPGEVVLTLDRRILPTETHDSAATEIQEALAPLENVEVAWRRGARPAMQEPTHPLVVAAQTSMEPAADSTPVGFSATCDQYIWMQAGIPAIIWGPGDVDENNVHSADEYVALSDVKAAALQYTRTAITFLDALQKE